MSTFVYQLLRCSCLMAVVTLLYTMAAIILKKRYSPKTFYYSGIVILLGFMIPFRPSISISIPSPIQSDVSLLQNTFAESLGRSGENQIGTAAVKSIIISPLQVAFLMWLVGAAVVLLYHGVQHVCFIRELRRWSTKVTERQTLAVFEEIKIELGIKSVLGLRTCTCISSPMLVQMQCPTIFLPDYYLSATELKLILHHEMVHFKRGDLLYKFALLLAAAINWFNPAIYLFAKVFSHICEVSCDEEVTEKLSDSVRYQYAMVVIDVAQRHTKRNTAFSTYFYGGKENMKHRISAIMSISKKRISITLLSVCLLLTLSAGIVFVANSFETRIDPADSTDKYWAAIEKGEEELHKEMIAAFSEDFSNEFHEEDFTGMQISYNEEGIPTVDDPSVFNSENTAVTAVTKLRDTPLYTSSVCDNSDLLFYIPKGKEVEVTDSYTGGTTSKVKYGGKTGYIKKSHLKF